MSKRALSRERGWIEFEGLRFALPYATRAEILKHTLDFFRARGVNLRSHGPRRFRIVFTNDERSCSVEEPQASGAFVGGSADVWSVFLYMRRIRSRSYFFFVLGHELDHAIWEMQGKPWDDFKKPHAKRYHERRATKAGKTWTWRSGTWFLAGLTNGLASTKLVAAKETA